MNNDLTLIAVILDRSGSMSSCQSDMEGGLNTFIQEQTAQPGSARLTLAQFDNEYELVEDYRDIQEAGYYQLVPRGVTALLDAIGRTVTNTGARLAAMPEDERPGKVVCVIITDGYENASKEWTKERVAALIKEQEEKYSWEFTYLGANQDAIATGTGMGFKASNSMTYDQDAASVASTFSSLSSNTSSHRVTGQGVSYSGEQRKAARASKRDKKA
jgi:uncharacterized protein YegL